MTKNYKKIIFLTDFLMHSPSAKSTYHNWLIKIINSVQKCASNVDIAEFRNYKKNDVSFDRMLKNNIICMILAKSMKNLGIISSIL